MVRIFKCSSSHYTLDEKCHECGAPARSPAPPKFSLEKEQKYGKYRRMGDR